MLPQTHMLISSYLYHEISTEYNICFSKFYFSLGSLMPDFCIKYKLKKHYMDKSFEMVLDMINNLYIDISKGKVSIHSFSYRLGLITHYLSDYFCFAHNNKHFTKNLLDHFIYEKNIHLYFTSIANFKEFDNVEISFDDKESIRNFILSIHNQYMNTNPSYEKDVYYTLNMVYSLSSCLIENAVFERKYVYLSRATA